mgnify:CR=1 FL=1
MGDYDQAYKQLFSHRQMVRELLEGFVPQAWVGRLDFTSLERVNASYVTDDLRERANDVVWRVRWGERWMYIYLMIEFQSRIEPYMAVRMLTYLGLLYQDLIRAGQLPAHGRLPPVLPIVLYNGRQRWTAPERLSELLESGPMEMESVQPQLRYLLIDQGSYDERDLVARGNRVALLFRIEQCRESSQLGPALAALSASLQRPEHQDLRTAFETWMRRVIIPRLPGSDRLAGAGDLMEMSTMLVERMYEWVEEARQEGRQEGRREGRQEGQREGRAQGCREGEALLLRRMLESRFGDLPPSIVQRLDEAPPEQLERWAVRLLSAATLEALFEDA